jgi:DNA-binding CsgD family transcriptional regulator
MDRAGIIGFRREWPGLKTGRRYMAQREAMDKRLGGRLTRIWPSLPYMGFGVWCAWAALAYSGSTWLSDVEVNGFWLSSMFIVSTLSFGVVCVLAPFRLSFAKRLLGSSRVLIASGAVTAAGALLIILAGPYYLGLHVFFWIGSVLSGLGTAVLGLKCGELYGFMTPRKSLLYSAVSQLLAAFVYFMAIGAPRWALIPGGPSFCGSIVFIGLPLLTAALLSMPARLADRSFLAESSDGGNDSSRPGLMKGVCAENLRMLPHAFWKMVAVVVLFSFLASMVRASVVNANALPITLEGNDVLQLLRFAVMLLFVYLAIDERADRFDFGKLYSLLIVAMVVAIALLPIFEGSADGWSILVYFISSVFEFIVWCLLAFIVFQKRISPLIVYGFGRGALMLGCGLGWLFGVSCLPVVVASVGPTAFFLVCAGTVLVLVSALFSERDFNRLFSSVSETALTLGNLMEEGLGEEKKDGKRGRFGSALDALAKRYGLSAREAEVMRFLAMGRGSDYIAEELSVSLNTARTHTHNVYVKLGIHSRQELIDLMDGEMRRP